ncbi:MAG: helix-turn-helix domain-containing protein [Patescibacteria group bacterium]
MSDTINSVQTQTLLTIEEVAQALKVSKMTIYRYIKAKRLPAYKLEQELRIKEDDLNEFLKKRKVKV